MDDLDKLLLVYYSEEIASLTREAINITQSTLRDGETLSLDEQRVITLGSNLKQVIDAINQQEEITVYMARSEESYGIIQQEGILNAKAVAEIRGIGRYDTYPLGSLYFRFSPESTKIAIIYKNGCILRDEEEKKHVIFGTSMILTGVLGEDFLVVPSVSDPTGTNFIIRDVIDCNTRAIQKTPYKESRFEKVGEFLYTLRDALAMFQHLPVDRIRGSFYRFEEQKRR